MGLVQQTKVEKVKPDQQGINEVIQSYEDKSYLLDDIKVLDKTLLLIFERGDQV